jgi:hypothetical protein
MLRDAWKLVDFDDLRAGVRFEPAEIEDTIGRCFGRMSGEPRMNTSPVP